MNITILTWFIDNIMAKRHAKQKEGQKKKQRVYYDYASRPPPSIVAARRAADRTMPAYQNSSLPRLRRACKKMRRWQMLTPLQLQPYQLLLQPQPYHIWWQLGLSKNPTPPDTTELRNDQHKQFKVTNNNIRRYGGTIDGAFVRRRTQQMNSGLRMQSVSRGWTIIICWRK